MVRPVKLVGKVQREYAKTLVDGVPDGWIVTFKEPTRSLDQNARLWSRLSDLSEQKPGGIVETAEGWKGLAMHAAGFECQFQMGLDGRPFPVGFRSSRLTVKQMSQLLDWITAYGDSQGVKWSEPEYQR